MKENLIIVPYQKMLALKHVDTANRRIRGENNEWIDMPNDDGFDEAFFMYLSNPLEDFEWIVYKTGVFPLPFFRLLLNCWYKPYVRLINIGKRELIAQDEFIAQIEAYYKATGRIK